MPCVWEMPARIKIDWLLCGNWLIPSEIRDFPKQQFHQFHPSYSLAFSVSAYKQAGHSRCLTQLTPILPEKFFKTNYCARQQHNGEETIFECRSSKMKEVTNSRTHQICHCANEEDRADLTLWMRRLGGTKTGWDWVTHTHNSQSVCRFVVIGISKVADFSPV